jgi:hypothetical protein
MAPEATICSKQAFLGDRSWVVTCLHADVGPALAVMHGMAVRTFTGNPGLAKAGYGCYQDNACYGEGYFFHIMSHNSLYRKIFNTHIHYVSPVGWALPTIINT